MCKRDYIKIHRWHILNLNPGPILNLNPGLMRRATASPRFPLVGLHPPKGCKCFANVHHGRQCHCRYIDHEDHGCGDPLRKLEITADEMDSVSSGGVQTKCHTFSNVPKGRWEVVLILKVNRSDYGCMASAWIQQTESNCKIIASQRIGFIKHEQGENRDNQEELQSNHNTNIEETLNTPWTSQTNDAMTKSRMQRLLSPHDRKWFLLSLGTLTTNHSKSAVKFEWINWPPSPQVGVKHVLLRGVELRAVGVSWDILRLLLLCQMGKAGDSLCFLQTLPPDAFDVIVEMLGNTPMPRHERVNHEAWRERRRQRQYALIL